MPAWPGGACPECGDEMPANLLHCVSCRALLNPDLSVRPIEGGEFFLLPEMTFVNEVPPVGYYVACPHCHQELRINGKYVGQRVACRFCSGQFDFRLDVPAIRITAFYSSCPHCNQEIRAAEKYRGAKVACKFCNGALRFVDAAAAARYMGD